MLAPPLAYPPRRPERPCTGEALASGAVGLPATAMVAITCDGRARPRRGGAPSGRRSASGGLPERTCPTAARVPGSRCRAAPSTAAPLDRRSPERRAARLRTRSPQRREERLAGDDVDVNAGRVVVPVLVLEWRLGRCVLRDLKLKRRKACVFRAHLGTRSGDTWARIPAALGQGFRSTWATIPAHLGTDSGALGQGG